MPTSNATTTTAVWISRRRVKIGSSAVWSPFTGPSGDTPQKLPVGEALQALQAPG